MSVRAESDFLFRSLFAVVLIAVCAGLCGCTSSAKPDNDPSPHLSRAAQRTQALRYVDQAQTAAKKGKNDEAIGFYQQALRLSTSLDGAWNNLGVLLLDRKSYQDAIFAFGRAADLNPGDPRPMTNIGIAYSRAGHAEKALRAFEDALVRDPNWIDALRGAAKSAKLLRIADEKSLDRIMHALLIEPDDEWRMFFERERFRIQGMIEARNP